MSKVFFCKKNKLKAIVAGIISGIINGFLGTGAGIVLVPAISSILNDSKKAHATTLICVLFMSIFSSVVFILDGNIDIVLSSLCVFGSVLGGIIGSVFLKKMKNTIIDLIFSLFLITAGIMMIIFR